MKLERGISRCARRSVVVVHYSPIVETVEEAPEICPFLGTSRLAEVIDRHGADLVLHGHAHHGRLDGRTKGGVPVHNVAISLLQAQTPSQVYRVFEL
jgi:Icc-related predicted phosphoesterase